jgi:hypothetical protein
MGIPSPTRRTRGARLTRTPRHADRGARAGGSSKWAMSGESSIRHLWGNQTDIARDHPSDCEPGLVDHEVDYPFGITDVSYPRSSSSSTAPNRSMLWSVFGTRYSCRWLIP